MPDAPRNAHPVCEHWVPVGETGEDGSPECCVCMSNPCPAVTVEFMVRHRDFDIDLWTRPVLAGGVDEPPF